MRIAQLHSAFLAVALAPSVNSIAFAVELNVVEHQRRTIYHSPQTPGFTSWVGAWTMPDGSLMVSFTQATGPIDGRPQAPGQGSKIPVREEANADAFEAR